MEIRESKTIDGKGLFVTKSFKKGEIVFVLTGEIFDHPTRESIHICLLYTSPSPRDGLLSRMPSSA